MHAQPGDRVLEIGTGTGWHAALLAHLIGPENVTSIEVDPCVADRARAALARHGKVTVITGDGAAGHPDRAPYDRVVATVGWPASRIRGSSRPERGDGWSHRSPATTSPRVSSRSPRTATAPPPGASPARRTSWRCAHNPADTAHPSTPPSPNYPPNGKPAPRCTRGTWPATGTRPPRSASGSPVSAASGSRPAHSAPSGSTPPNPAPGRRWSYSTSRPTRCATPAHARCSTRSSTHTTGGATPAHQHSTSGW
ncbi:methyltransferase domain-containing protein [Pseudonocardia sp.]|uniref:methyltransferase domain-containing protein n=1 Tax=Pseudonocardia sp. TaxID=60912 RepID=UPI0039C91265